MTAKKPKAEKQKQVEQMSLNGEKVFKKVEPDKKFPSHSLLYRDYHIIEKHILMEIFKTKKWNFEGLKHEVFLEHNNWDIIYRIEKSKDKFIENERSLNQSIGCSSSFFIGVEYKSSIKEWGKQIDAFFRQIRERVEKNAKYTRIQECVLLTFDERFKKYDKACEMARITLVVLDLDKLQNTFKLFDLFEED